MLQIISDLYSYAKKCLLCQARCQHPTKQCLLQLFSPKEPLHFVAVNILRPLAKTETGNMLIVMMKDRYLKLTRPILMKRTTATDMAQIFVEGLVVPYSLSDRLLAGPRSKFAGNVLIAVCAELDTKLLQRLLTIRGRTARPSGTIKPFSVISFSTLASSRKTKKHSPSRQQTPTTLRRTQRQKRSHLDYP